MARFEESGRGIKAFFPRGRNEIFMETSTVEAHLLYGILQELKKLNEVDVEKLLPKPKEVKAKKAK